MGWIWRTALENGAQRKAFGSEREEVTGDGRKLRREELVICTVYQIYLGDEIRKNVMGGACSRCGGE